MGLGAVEQLAAEVDEFHWRALRGWCAAVLALRHRAGGSNHGRIVRYSGDDTAREGGGWVRVHRGAAVASRRVLLLRRYPPEPAVSHGAGAEAGGGAQDHRRQRHDVRSAGAADPLRGRWPHGDAARGERRGDDAGGSLRGQEAEPAERRDLPFERFAVFHRSGLSRADGRARAGRGGVPHRAGWGGQPGGAGGVSERPGAVAGRTDALHREHALVPVHPRGGAGCGGQHGAAAGVRRHVGGWHERRAGRHEGGCGGAGVLHRHRRRVGVRAGRHARSASSRCRRCAPTARSADRTCARCS